MFTLAAGANPQIGSVILVLMLGFWLIWIVNNGNKIKNFNAGVQAATQGVA